MVGHSVGVRRACGGTVIAGAVVLSALLLAVPTVGAGAVVPTDGGAPLAEAGLDQEVRRGETVRLDATGSHDPDGRVVAYEWRIETPGGLTVSPREPRAARTSFPATAVGRYEITLTVTDDAGNTGTDTMYVRVGRTGDGPPAGGGGPTAPPGNGTSTGPGVDRDGPVTGSGDRAGVDGTAAAAAACSAGHGGIGGSCSSSGQTSAPWARIEGPAVVVEGRSYTYAAETGGLGGGRRYEWEGGDTGRRHALRFGSSGDYVTRVDVRDRNGETATDRLEVFVSIRANERPSVEITDPGRVAPGEPLVLSAEATDPDGVVRTTEWSPARRVRVPADGSSLTVRVTVTDDDGASVTDAVTLTGEAWNRTGVPSAAGTSAVTDVTCYFTDERQREGENPHSDRCVVENGNTVSLGVGPSRIGSFRREESIDLHWRRTNESHLRRLEANDTGTEYGVAAGSPHDRADTFGYSEDLVRGMGAGRRVDVANDEAFTLKGRTVEDDLDGDGEVNAADWDRRYRTTGDTANVDQHADAAGEFKRSVRSGRGPDSESDPVDLTWDATAETVDETFVGASIDEENRHDRVADLTTDALAGTDPGHDRATGDGTGTPSGSESLPDPAGDTGDAAGGTADPGTGNAGGSGGTDDAGGTEHEENADGGGSGSGGEGPSRHDPHGGRVVVRP